MEGLINLFGLFGIIVFWINRTNSVKSKIADISLGDELFLFVSSLIVTATSFELLRGIVHFSLAWFQQ